ncbi:hypothetical protein D3C81_2082240 [compost metagenome]
MNAGTIEQVQLGIAIEAHFIGISKDRFIPIGGRPVEGDTRPLCQRAPAQHDLFRSHPTVHNQRCMNTQYFIDGGR